MKNNKRIINKTEKKVVLVILASLLLLTIFIHFGNEIRLQNKRLDRLEKETIIVDTKEYPTMWNLAQDICPEGIDLNIYLHLLIEENNNNSSMYDGREIVILVEKEV